MRKLPLLLLVVVGALAFVPLGSSSGTSSGYSVRNCSTGPPDLYRGQGLDRRIWRLYGSRRALAALLLEHARRGELERLPADSCRATRTCSRTRPAPARPGTSSSTRRSGSGWRCATPSRSRSTTRARARPTATRNIFDGTDPSSPNYIGKHPGTAFMEMQFYPPGWVPWPPGVSCDATQWCAALTIDSLNQNGNTGQPNNDDCRHGRHRAGLASRSSRTAACRTRRPIR